MVIDMRTMMSVRSQTASRKELLIQKSILNQRLSDSMKCLNAWKQERDKWNNESSAYMNRITELWYKGEWDDAYYHKLCVLSYEASERIGSLCEEVGALKAELNWLNSKLGL